MQFYQHMNEFAVPITSLRHDIDRAHAICTCKGKERPCFQVSRQEALTTEAAQDMQDIQVSSALVYAVCCAHHLAVATSAMHLPEEEGWDNRGYNP